jgi:PTS system nitrogen regulatory IIA component
MKLDQIFLPGDAIDRPEATSKRQVLDKIAATFAASRGLDEKTVFDVLRERERLGSTAIGGGIAIPHAKMAGLPALVGCILRLEPAVDFDAGDEQPVDLVVALLAPDNGGADHLRVLARLSRSLRDPRFCAALRACPDAACLHRLLVTEVQEQRAA